MLSPAPWSAVPTMLQRLFFKMEWRLIQDGYHDAYTNMAIDEVLLPVETSRYLRRLLPEIGKGGRLRRM